MMRVARMVGHALTIGGAVRVIGEMFEVEDIPAESEQIRRWGEIKVEWAPPEAVEAYQRLRAGPQAAAPPEPPASEETFIEQVEADMDEEGATTAWVAMSGEELLESVTAMGDAQLEKFLAWASSNGATEDARIIAQQFS